MTQTAADIRRAFLGFFEKNGHTALPSSPLVPHNDPTLLFVNSGMVQFKDVFTGKETRPYTRATTAQKCVRAGGKHNDLDNVGYTARHHTFFEMLGNFSFGDYFKEEAISYAWTLVTSELGLKPDNLLVTVHSSDEEAASLWRKIASLPDSRIIRIPTSDNFWQMGDTGPCGPCTELFIDQGPALEGGPPGSPNEDGDRFLEFWNLVFMQFEQLPGGERLPLPRPCVDTGMGLERMAAILQGKLSNYDCDLLASLTSACADLTGVGTICPSHRVIADHVRACAFLIADGVMPSSEGRGYVLRRIMRRAMRHAHLLGAKEPLLHRLFPVLEGLMSAAYPELTRAKALILETLRGEEERFGNTLERGLALLSEETQHLASGQKLSGTVAFRLYDTYGFPLDLIQDVLRGQGRSVDIAEFEAAMTQQKVASRAAWQGTGDVTTDKVWFDVLEEFGPTTFVGYETIQAEAKVLALVLNPPLTPPFAREGNAENLPPLEQGDANKTLPPLEQGGVRGGLRRVEALTEGQDGFMITDKTPFYAESGGQVGDMGTLVQAGDIRAYVTNTTKPAPGLHVHHVKVREGALRVGDEGDLVVDGARRAAIRANHSATHLLHAALREVLGAHVTQRGSLVTENRLRFDIAHPSPLTPLQAEAVETLVNAHICANAAVMTDIMVQEEALAAGAMALFGEKYDSKVRVLTMGQTSPPSERGGQGGGHPFSRELCGGTHVTRTGDIGCLVITSDTALAAGVRRLEALTGPRALAYLKARAAKGQEAADILKTSLEDLPQRVTALMTQHREAEKQVATLRQKLATSGGPDVRPAQDIGGMKYLTRIFDDMPICDLKTITDVAKRQIGSGVTAMISRCDGKATLVVGVTDDLISTLSAVDLVRVGVEVLGGKGGGGRPDLAQGGGPNAGAAENALNAIGGALLLHIPK